MTKKKREEKPMEDTEGEMGVMGIGKEGWEKKVEGSGKEKQLKD